LLLGVHATMALGCNPDRLKIILSINGLCCNLPLDDSSQGIGVTWVE
jgi:hypothetical protein